MNPVKKEVKIVQISATPASSLSHWEEHYSAGLYALSSNGDVYFIEQGCDDWYKLPPIPQD